MYPKLRDLQMPCRLEQLVELDHLSMMCHASPSMGATVTCWHASFTTGANRRFAVCGGGTVEAECVN